MQQGQWKESERLLQVGIDALDAEMVGVIVQVTNHNSELC
jgi:hypothetical protein